jgi:hypothetical protein
VVLVYRRTPHPNPLPAEPGRGDKARQTQRKLKWLHGSGLGCGTADGEREPEWVGDVVVVVGVCVNQAGAAGSSQARDVVRVWNVDRVLGVLPHVPLRAASLHRREWQEVWRGRSDSADLLCDPDHSRGAGGCGARAGFHDDLAGVAAELGGPPAAGSRHLSDLGLRVSDRRYHLRPLVPLADGGCCLKVFYYAWTRPWVGGRIAVRADARV